MADTIAAISSSIFTSCATTGLSEMDSAASELILTRIVEGTFIGRGHHHTIRAVKSLTRAGEVLAAEIMRSGPIRFSRFMDVALYHPEFGYYRHANDPFGTSGDFYTAEQLQPVFGRLIAAYLRMLWQEPQLPTLVELGAGRGEWAEAFARFRYIPIDTGFAEMPQRSSGIISSNEFFYA